MKFSVENVYLIFIFYLAPFIDAFSGYLILSKIIPEGGAGSPSQLFRLIIMLLSLWILLKQKKFFYVSLRFIAYIFLIEFVFFSIHQSIFGFVIGIVYGSKLIYLFLLFITLYHLYLNGKLNFNSLLSYIQKYVLIMALFIVLPFILGVGFSSYKEGSFGTKGFFAAGNGLGIFMGIGLMLSIFFWQHTRRKFSLFVSLILVFATSIIGTKTALIFSVTGLFAIVYYLKNRFLSFFIVGGVATFLLFYYQYIIDSLGVIFDVIFYRFQNNDSFFSFLMSSRDVYLQDALNSVSYDGLYIVRLVFGFGVYVSFRDPMADLTGIDTLESDFADIFFMYGFFVLVGYLLILIMINLRFLFKRQFFLGFTFFMLYVHSLMAGHVLFNGMSGVMLPLLILLAITCEKNKNKKQIG